MMSRANRQALFRLPLPAAGGLVLAAWSGAAMAADATIVAGEPQTAGASLELIGGSRLGCGQGTPMWTVASGGSQCPFDTATRGASVAARHDLGSGTIDAYATMARTTTGAFTPDRLLVAPAQRTTEAADLLLVGVKAAALDNRLKLTAEFARTEHVVDALIERDWALADRTSDSGTSALLKLEAVLADRPGLKWTLTGEYRAVSDDFSTGPSPELVRFFAMPGTRLALSSKGRIGALGLSAGIERLDGPFGLSASRKATADFQGLSLTLRARTSSSRPIEGMSLLDSTTRRQEAYLDLDSQALAGWLFPALLDLPAFVPANIAFSIRSGETENRDGQSVRRYGRSSFGIDGIWETPIGETSVSFWRDRRIGQTDGARSSASDTLQLAHSVRRGHWRFGVDATLTRSRGDGANAYDERGLSFGQSIAYSAPNGPELRLQLGQDRGTMRMADDSYASLDRASSITASVDLSRYLQARFERPDLRLTLDYRKALERSDAEMSLYDELVERWVDGYRREGLLVSFGMVL